MLQKLCIDNGYLKKRVKRLGGKLIGNQSHQRRYKGLQKICLMLQMFLNQLDKTITKLLIFITIGSEVNVEN